MNRYQNLHDFLQSLFFLAMPFGLLGTILLNTKLYFAICLLIGNLLYLLLLIIEFLNPELYNTTRPKLLPKFFAWIMLLLFSYSLFQVDGQLMLCNRRRHCDPKSSLIYVK